MNFSLFSNPFKLLVLTAVVSIASCKKDDVSSTGSQNNNAASLSDSSTVADNTYYDVLNDAFVGYSDNATVWGASNRHSSQNTTFSTNKTLGEPNMSCATYTISNTTPGVYPKIMTVDFGAGCTSPFDGIFRQGKVIYNFNGPLLDSGTVASVTFDGFIVNGYAIQGAYSITNLSTNDTLIVNTQVTDGIITYPTGTNYHYGHNKTYKMIAGGGTLTIADDIYQITGNSSFSSADGSSLAFNVTTPLVKAVSCRNVQSGVAGFIYDGSIKGTIDFGDGTCDSLATITVGNINQTISLR